MGIFEIVTTGDIHPFLYRRFPISKEPKFQPVTTARAWSLGRFLRTRGTCSHHETEPPAQLAVGP